MQFEKESGGNGGPCGVHAYCTDDSSGDPGCKCEDGYDNLVKNVGKCLKS